MALWYQCDASTWWWWSYVADLGPYDGTVPLPRPLWLPNEAAEIDYVVGIPHPSGDPRRFRDGTYDVHALEGDFSGSYSFSFVPGGPLSGGTYGSPTGPAPGAHLFVQFYRTGYPSGPTLPPPKPALAYVPSALIAGGYGPTIGAAGWSEWQPGYEFTIELSPVMQMANEIENVSNELYRHSTGEWPNIDADIRSMISDTAASVGTQFLDGTDWLPNFIGGSPSMVPIRWDLAGSSVGIAASDEFESYVSFPGPFTWVRNFYVALTFDSSTAAAELPTTTPSVPDDAETIPVEERDARTIDNLVQLEAGSNVFDSWNDETYTGQLFFVTDDIAANPSYVGDGATPNHTPAYFDPPAAMPYFFGVTDPIAPLSADPGPNVDGIPLYVAPPISASDLDPLTTAHLPINGSVTPGSPYTYDYTGGGGNRNETEVDISIDLPYSSVTRPSFTVVAMSGYFNGEPLPFSGTSQPFYLGAQLVKPGADRGSFFNDRTVSLNLRTPRWRYWKTGGLEYHCPGGGRPRITVTEGHPSDWLCTDPILRLSQRNDGQGGARHPRLLSSTSAPSSAQRSAAPRLGSNGRYR